MILGQLKMGEYPTKSRALGHWRDFFMFVWPWLAKKSKQLCWWWENVINTAFTSSAQIITLKTQPTQGHKATNKGWSKWFYKKDGKLGKMVLLQMAMVAQVAVLGAASQVGSVFLGTGLGLASLSNWIWRFRNIAKRTMDPRVESFCQSSSK